MISLIALIAYLVKHYHLGDKIMHKHKCDECGHIWEHEQNPDWTPEEHHAAHTCICGQKQTWKFFGEDHPLNPTPEEKKQVENLFHMMSVLDAIFRPR